MTIKNWFVEKNFSSQELLAITGCEPSVERETDKALLLSWDTDYGKISRWVPKSCILTEADLASENTPDKCAARLQKIQSINENYQALINLCKLHGISARKGMRAATMREKLKSVGVDYHGII